MIPAAGASGGGGRIDTWGSTGAAGPLRIAQIPSASKRAIKIHQCQLAAEIIRHRNTLGGIHLNLSINDFQIVGETAVVADGGKTNKLGIRLGAGHRRAVCLGQLLMSGKRSGHLTECLCNCPLEGDFGLVPLSEGGVILTLQSATGEDRPGKVSAKGPRFASPCEVR